MTICKYRDKTETKEEVETRKKKRRGPDHCFEKEKEKETIRESNEGDTVLTK